MSDAPEKNPDKSHSLGIKIMWPLSPVVCFFPQQLFHPSDSLSPFLFWFPLDFRYPLLCVCRGSGTPQLLVPCHQLLPDLTPHVCVMMTLSGRHLVWHQCSLEGCWVPGDVCVCMRAFVLSLLDRGSYYSPRLYTVYSSKYPAYCRSSVSICGIELLLK